MSINNNNNIAIPKPHHGGVEGGSPEAVSQHLDSFNSRSLKQIDISMNGLQGDIPMDGIGNSTQLVHLDMSLNRFNGSIPNQIFSLTSLGYLDMSENLLEGKLGPELKFYVATFFMNCFDAYGCLAYVWILIFHENQRRRNWFELDMLLDSVNSALKRVEELLNGINNHLVSSEGSIRVEDHYSALNLCCIERLYGDHGFEVMETLCKSPSTVAPVILILAEIKETKEKSQKDDDVLYNVAVGKVCSTKEQVNQVLKLWTTFLEPMLYVPSRPENFDNVEDVEISTRGATRNEVDSSKVIMVNGGTLPKEDGSRVEKDVKNTCIRDKAPAVGVVNDNVLPRSSTELSGRDATPRPRNVHDDDHEAKSNIDEVPSSQKEEGELSPNVYFDEADLAAYCDHNGSNAKAKHSMEIDADADDEDSKNVLEGGDDVSGSESTGRS
ncbi:paired amphipathic helix protein Sin3-like protein 2 isoform X3 [Tanacetum coccineum]